MHDTLIQSLHSTPIRWSYLNETVHPFGPTTNPIGVFKIPNTVNPKKPNIEMMKRKLLQLYRPLSTSIHHQLKNK